MPSKVPNVFFLPQRRPSQDHDVLRRIIHDHESTIRRFLRARLADHPDCDDLVQDLYVRLVRQANLDERLSLGEAQTRSYLISMAHNLVRDRHRREVVRERTKSMMAEEEPLAPSPEDVLVSRRDLAAIRKAILGLPSNCRRAFVLSRFENLSYRQIAEEMNISISMVEKHILRALAALRTCVRR